MCFPLLSFDACNVYVYVMFNVCSCDIVLSIQMLKLMTTEPLFVFVDVQWTVWFLRWEHTRSSGKLCECLLDCFSSFRCNNACAVKVCKYEFVLHSRVWQLGQSSRDLHLPRGTFWASTWNRERIWSFETNAPVGQQPAASWRFTAPCAVAFCCWEKFKLALDGAAQMRRFLYLFVLPQKNVVS